MTDTEFQKIILEKLIVLEENQSRLEAKTVTKDDLTQLESKLDQNSSHLETKLLHLEDKLSQDLSHLNTKFLHLEDKLGQDFSRLESKIDLLASEIPQDITGLLKLMNNKLDTIATKEDIARIEDILDVLAARTTRHEAEILNLKRAK